MKPAFPWRIGQGELGFYTNIEIGVVQNVTRVAISMQSPLTRMTLYLFLVYTSNSIFHVANRGAQNVNLRVSRGRSFVILGRGDINCIRNNCKQSKTILHLRGNERTKSNSSYDLCVNFFPIQRFFVRVSIAFHSLST